MLHNNVYILGRQFRTVTMLLCVSISAFLFSCQEKQEAGVVTQVSLEEQLSADSDFQSLLALSAQFSTHVSEKMLAMNEQQRNLYVKELQQVSTIEPTDASMKKIALTLGFSNETDFTTLVQAMTAQRSKLYTKYPSLEKLSQLQRQKVFQTTMQYPSIQKMMMRTVPKVPLLGSRTTGDNCSTCSPEYENCRTGASASYAATCIAGIATCAALAIAPPLAAACGTAVVAAAAVKLNADLSQCNINYTRCRNSYCS